MVALAPTSCRLQTAPSWVLQEGRTATIEGESTVTSSVRIRDPVTKLLLVCLVGGLAV